MQNDQNKKRVIPSYYGMTADPEGAVWIDPYTGEVMKPCINRNYEGDCRITNKLCPGVCPEGGEVE